jgi:hypothetical protein
MDQRPGPDRGFWLMTASCCTFVLALYVLLGYWLTGAP